MDDWIHIDTHCNKRVLLVCWFVFGATDFTVKENIIHSLVSEAIFLIIRFESYLLAGGM